MAPGSVSLFSRICGRMNEVAENLVRIKEKENREAKRR
jgi:hypothetical protein